MAEGASRRAICAGAMKKTFSLGRRWREAPDEGRRPLISQPGSWTNPSPAASRRPLPRERAYSDLAVIVPVAVLARLHHLVAQQRDRDAKGDDAAEDFREAETDEEADDRAAGDELRRMLGSKRLHVEGSAQLAIELIDARADVVARALDLLLDRLLLRLGHA